MDIEQQYDEFGNFIGPEENDSDSDSLELPDLPVPETVSQHTEHLTEASKSNGFSAALETTIVEDEVDPSVNAEENRIVLAEDKQYYPDAKDVFGKGTEVLIEEEDADAIQKPLVEPPVELSSGYHESEDSAPSAKYSRAYLTSAILPNPKLVRNVALVGHLHHGKTTFADMLFDSTHQMQWENLNERSFPVRYMDTRFDEQDLHISIKTTAATFLLQSPLEKSYGITILDTPGHTNFLDEALAALTLVDGVVVVVDVAEGVMMGTEMLLRKAAKMNLDIVLVISKLDRLCVELRLPPNDAYHKIRYIIENVNEILKPFNAKPLSPAHGNVAFSAASQRVCFTLHQFAEEYIKENGGKDRFPLNENQMAARLWGDVYYNDKTRKFTRKKQTYMSQRTFISFILEPFYKLHTAVVSTDADDLTEYLKRNDLLEQRETDFGRYTTKLTKKDLRDNVKTMLKKINSTAFGMGSMTGFTDMVVKNIRSPVDSAESKFNSLIKPEERDLIKVDSDLKIWAEASSSCNTDTSTPFNAFVAKVIPDDEGIQFDCLLRIMSGSVQVGQTVKVLGNEYARASNREDQVIARISKLFLPCGRFRVSVPSATAGQIVLVRGIDHSILKSATVISADHPASTGAFIFRPLEEYMDEGVVKVAVEPIRPSDLPKMVASLRKCVTAYPGLTTRVEQTGEHTLIGSGELYMDCVLRDLRDIPGKLEVKVSDPVVPFSETVSETSALQCYADTPNDENRITAIAEPLEDSILEALKDGRLERSRNAPSVLRECGWDALAAQSLWAFGPDTSTGPNALLNDILIQDVRRKSDDVRDSIVQGFSWAMREGPLASEPVRNTKIRLLNATVSEQKGNRSRAQIIPACRRVMYSSMLTANPKLMEPVYLTEIICPPKAVDVCYTLIGRRRGAVISEGDIAGTPFRRVMVHMPVLDSFGFEPDLRSLTHGAAFCLQTFDHWEVVPGDPLDKTVELRALEPAGRRELARECMIKTRRRKGLTDEVAITKYFDDPLLLELAADNEELKRLL